MKTKTLQLLTGTILGQKKTVTVPDEITASSGITGLTVDEPNALGHQRVSGAYQGKQHACAYIHQNGSDDTFSITDDHGMVPKLTNGELQLVAKAVALHTTGTSSITDHV